MTPENFVYWLQGYVEIAGQVPSIPQWEIIKDHLAHVFNKVTPDRQPRVQFDINSHGIFDAAHGVVHGGGIVPKTLCSSPAPIKGPGYSEVKIHLQDFTKVGMIGDPTIPWTEKSFLIRDTGDLAGGIVTSHTC